MNTFIRQHGRKTERIYTTDSDAVHIHVPSTPFWGPSPRIDAHDDGALSLYCHGAYSAHTSGTTTPLPCRPCNAQRDRGPTAKRVDLLYYFSACFLAFTVFHRGSL